MRNRTYGGVRGRKTKVGRKLLRFPPTRFSKTVVILLICGKFGILLFLWLSGRMICTSVVVAILVKTHSKMLLLWLVVCLYCLTQHIDYLMQ